MLSEKGSKTFFQVLFIHNKSSLISRETILQIKIFNQHNK
jgi:hypothetical protein